MAAEEEVLLYARRVVVYGSRDADDEVGGATWKEVLRAFRISGLRVGVDTIIHGANNTGIDKIVEEIVGTVGHSVMRYYPNPLRHKKGAEGKRNEDMIVRGMATELWLFHWEGQDSDAMKDLRRIAEKNGVHVIFFTIPRPMFIGGKRTKRRLCSMMQKGGGKPKEGGPAVINRQTSGDTGIKKASSYTFDHAPSKTRFGVDMPSMSRSDPDGVKKQVSFDSKKTSPRGKSCRRGRVMGGRGKGCIRRGSAADVPPPKPVEPGTYDTSSTPMMHESWTMPSPPTSPVFDGPAADANRAGERLYASPHRASPEPWTASPVTTGTPSPRPACSPEFASHEARASMNVPHVLPSEIFKYSHHKKEKMKTERYPSVSTGSITTSSTVPENLSRYLEIEQEVLDEFGVLVINDE